MGHLEVSQSRAFEDAAVPLLPGIPHYVNEDATASPSQSVVVVLEAPITPGVN